jgi:peptide/nickel transport system substrate-binding protein
VTGAAPSPLGPVTMDRRRFLAACLGGVGALALGGCSPGSGSGSAGARTLRLPGGAIGFPSPFAANAGPGYQQMVLVYDTLLWKDGSGQLLPWLASGHDVSADHLTHTFRLRPDVTWSDGRPLTAHDAAFTFGYYAEQEVLPPPVLVQPPAGIADVRAVDDATVTVTLEKPLVTFSEQVAGAVPIIPGHVWSSIDDPPAALDLDVLVGSGPYRLRSYAGDGGPMLFTARQDHFLGPPHVTRVEYEAVEDQFAALLGGGTDVARGTGLRDDVLAPFAGDAGFGTVTERGASARALYWNLGREGALADVRFRRACAMAVDRAALVSRLAAGRGLPGNPGFLSPANPWFAPVRQYELDLPGAAALLDGAGYLAGEGGVRRDAAGRPLRFELLIDAAEAPLAEVLAEALGRIGVDLRTKAVQIGPQLFGTKLTGGYDMAVLPYPGPVPGGPNSDPDLLRLLFSSEAGPSLMGATTYANRAFDDLAERQRTAFVHAERKAMVAEMQRIVADDLPVLVLYYPDTSMVFRKRALDVWYFTPGQFPVQEENKHLFVTGRKAGVAPHPDSAPGKG